MANLQESAVWEDGIYQWETEDPVVGGAEGIDNVPTRQLANRTKYLKQQVELKAPINSPTLTGVPKVPTANADTNTTQIASTEFVIGQAATVVPLANGVAAVGTSKKFARQDHVHPSDSNTVYQSARYNLKISYSGTSGAVTVTADSLSLHDAAYATFLTLKALSLTATSGSLAGMANGLDTGVWAYATFYNLFVIYNKTTDTSALLWSLSATAPILPDGYTYFVRIGANKTQPANYWFNSGIQINREFQFKLNSSLTSFPQMASGSQGSPSTPTWVAVATTQFVPPTAAAISVSAHMATYTKGIIVAPNSSYGGYNSLVAPPPICMSVTSGNESNGASAKFLLESTAIYYACDDASYGSLVCTGWEDNI